jgi:predicted Zn finger-like uncharacterized protein
MMKLFTRCPHCETAFRVTPAQLQSSGGQVRCGRCDRVFDAFSSLSSKQPGTAEKTVSLNEVEFVAPPPEAPAPLETVPAAEMIAAESPQESTDESVPSPARDEEWAEPETTRGEPDANLYEWEFRPAKPEGWPWLAIIGSLLALFALAAQATIAFRNPLTMEFPETKPWMIRACERLHCSLSLPRLDEKLNIESSGLESVNPAQPSQILLTAAVRNRATLAVAYPALELTLTDDHDLAIARRVFLPQEYLASSTDLNRGFEAGSEVNVRLYLDTADLRAAGYRLYLFYP